MIMAKNKMASPIAEQNEATSPNSKLMRKSQSFDLDRNETYGPVEQNEVANGNKLDRRSSSSRKLSSSMHPPASVENKRPLENKRPTLLRRTLSSRNFSNGSRYRNMIGKSLLHEDAPDNEGRATMMSKNLSSGADVSQRSLAGSSTGQNFNLSTSIHETKDFPQTENDHKAEEKKEEVDQLSSNVTTRRSPSARSLAGLNHHSSKEVCGRQIKRCPSDIGDRRSAFRKSLSTRNMVSSSAKFASLNDADEKPSSVAVDRRKAFRSSLSIRNLSTSLSNRSGHGGLCRGVQLESSSTSSSAREDVAVPPTNSSRRALFANDKANSSENIVTGASESRGSDSFKVKPSDTKEAPTGRRMQLFHSKSSIDGNQVSSRRMMLGRTMSLRNLGPTRSNSKSTLEQNPSKATEESHTLPPKPRGPGLQRIESIRRSKDNGWDAESSPTNHSSKLQLKQIAQDVVVRIIETIRRNHLLRFVWLALLDTLLWLVGKVFSFAAWILAMTLNAICAGSQWLVNQPAFQQAVVAVYVKVKPPKAEENQPKQLKGD